MKKLILILLISQVSFGISQNILTFPPAITSQNISLNLQNGTTTFYNGVVTNTMGANGNLLGPTIILQKDSFVSINVHNQLADTTTIHWHGLHISPENDGGPHSIILPGTNWNPQFTVKDQAGTFWYHPHLHSKTDEHVSKGIAGMIFVRDSLESTLNLPTTYAIDEFPIVIQTKGFDANGQIEVHTEMDTSVMVNGIVNPQTDFPAQIVRLRLLNGSSQRVMEIGFSNNKYFHLIGTDGGLLNSPVTLARYRLAPGQRIDLLLDLTSDMGSNFQLMSFGSELPNAIYGAAQPGMGAGATIPGYANNPLNGNDFSILDINVVAQTSNPILTMPTSLANNTPLLESSANANRSLTFTSASGMGDIVGPFLINNSSFDMNVMNYTIPLNNVEIWTLTNQTPIAHPFHIHDIQFYILDINGTPPPPEMQGLNDVVLVPGGMGTVRFITQFTDFSDSITPYMYHCHMLTHEDMGMMGQFLVVNSTNSIEESNENNSLFTIYPNPLIENTLNLSFADNQLKIKEIYVFNSLGQLIFSSHDENIQNRITFTSKLNSGVYLIKVITKNGQVFAEKITVQ